MQLAPEANARSSSETTPDIRCRIARTREEREAAFRLVYSSYLRSGLGEMNSHEVRVTPYHLLPTTEVFIAEYRNEVIFTMSLVADGAMGVPMEHVYGEEIDAQAPPRAARRRGFVPGRSPCGTRAVLSRLPSNQPVAGPVRAAPRA